MRRGSASIVANPVLVGAVTTLVVVVAVFLAYNANNGLPFVPTRTAYVQLTNGSELVRGNEVRVGGFRVGVIDDMVPVRMRDGLVGARLKLKLDRKVGDLPVDTTVTVRQKGSLGLKYIQLDRGTSRKTLPDGSTLPVQNGHVFVDLDQVYNMFDKKTRVAEGTALNGFGDAFAYRGQSLNDFVQQAPALFKVLAPVAHNLADNRTQLAQFFQALERTTEVVDPIAAVYAGTFRKMADTFAAIDNDPQALKDTISKSPPAELASIKSFRVQRPFLDDTAKFSRDLSSAVQELKPTLPVVNDALEIGTPVQLRSVQLNQELQGALTALRDLTKEPTTYAALLGLTDTVATLQPTVRSVGPYVTVCNSWNMFWTFAAEHLSEVEPGIGTAERALLNSGGDQSNSVASGGAVLPAAGLGVRGNGDPQFLHSAAYGNAIGPNGHADCEGGQQGYPSAGNSFTQFRDTNVTPNYFHVVNDAPHNRENSGPTYKLYDINGHGFGGLNPDTPPVGETWSNEPGGKAPQQEIPK
jgi:virulence factor Mce-like protein